MQLGRFVVSEEDADEHIFITLGLLRLALSYSPKKWRGQYKWPVRSTVRVERRQIAIRGGRKRRFARTYVGLPCSACSYFPRKEMCIKTYSGHSSNRGHWPHRRCESCLFPSFCPRSPGNPTPLLSAPTSAVTKCHFFHLTFFPNPFT